MNIRPLSAEESIKVENNMQLVYKMAHKFNRPDKFDDLVQEGSIGLILAVQRFDKSNGAQFSTYACNYIKGYMSMWLYRDYVIKPKIKDKVFTRPNICELDENIEAASPFTELDTTLCNKIYDSLSGLQAMILVMTEQGYTQEEIAKITGLPQSKISIELKAIRENTYICQIAKIITDKGD